MNTEGMMSKLLAFVFIAALAVGLQVLVMIYGWGLAPVSWWWIIGGGVFGATAIRTMLNVVEKETKDG